MPSTSIFAQVEDRSVLPSTIDLWGGGRERIKPHLEVIICIFEPWTKTLRHSNIIQKQAPRARQTPDARPPPPPHKGRGDVRATPPPPKV
jgi:hypothetical protein